MPDTQSIDEAAEERRHAKFTRRAECIAWLIVAGLALDLVIIICISDDPPWLKTLGAIANVLIVGGVAGELWFERIARTSGDTVAALVRERAANAELRLAEYRKTRRELLAGNTEKLVAQIEPFKGTNIDIGYADGDREQMDFLWDIEPLIDKAGWVFLDWYSSTGICLRKVKPPGPGERTYGIANVLNVTIELHPARREQLLPAAQEFADALNGMGISATIETHPIASTSLNAGAVHFLVGHKR